VSYLTSGWINGLDPGSVRTISINGLPAATAAASARGYAYLVAVVRFGDQTYRFLFATRNPSADFERAFVATVSSFRALSAEDKARLKPLRIRVVTVAPGDTAETLARRMAPLERPVVLFRVINGFGPADQPRVGSKVKIISES
jgi:predicted Zn-dependent protease